MLEIPESRLLINEVALSLRGSPIAVLCGGPSLPSSMPLLTGAASFISANEHGCRAMRCDYIVCADLVHGETGECMETRLRKHRTPIISPLFFSDYRIPNWDAAWNSGMHAVWVAWMLGGDPILLAGADCYTGKSYFHANGKTSAGHDRTPEFFISMAEDARNNMPGARVRVVGGGLLEAVWPRFDLDEVFDEREPSITQRLLATPQPRATIRARESLHIWKTRLDPYFQLEVTRAEARQLVAAGVADILEGVQGPARPPRRALLSARARRG